MPSESFLSPSKGEHKIPRRIPLKRLREDDGEPRVKDADDSGKREELSPRKLDMDSEVTLANPSVEDDNNEDEEEEVVVTQKYEPEETEQPGEQLEEGEILPLPAEDADA